MTPPPHPKKKKKKKIHKILIPKNYSFFLKTPKEIKIQNFEPPKNQSLRMYGNIRVTPLGRQFANIIISSTFDEVSHAIKKKSCGKNQNSNRTHGLGSVLSQVQCHVHLYQMTSSSSCKLAI